MTLTMARSETHPSFPTSPQPTSGQTAMLRVATMDDRAAVHALCEEFCAEDGHPFGARQRDALDGLLAGTPHGIACLIESDAGGTAGYVVLSFGYSVEFGGPDGLIDEIYVVPAYRGSGLGRAVLETMISVCLAAGFSGLHLEVMDSNPRARLLYERLGFSVRLSRLASMILETPQ